MRDYRKEREGQEGTNCEGLPFRIKAYRGALDVDVEFEDGAVREHVSYNNFLKGSVRHPDTAFRKERPEPGEVRVNRDGRKMTLEAVRGPGDADVVFEDGSARRGVPVRLFLSGRLRHPADRRKTAGAAEKAGRPGETRLNRKGELMEIVAYRRADDMDVRFEDGTVVEHARYGQFKKGTISKDLSPKVLAAAEDRVARARERHLGEEGVNLSGERMRIAAYRRSTDIDVEFEDGTVRKHVCSTDFKKGRVSKVSRKALRAGRIGETSVSAKGETMTIVGFRSRGDISVRFPDGAVRDGVDYSSFKEGHVSHPGRRNLIGEEGKAARTGESSVNAQGLEMRILAYRSAADIDVVFEDGAVKEGVSYWAFSRGAVTHPKAARGRKTFLRTGEARKNSEGLEMRILAYRGCRDMDVVFEDGAVRRHVQYSAFKQGKVSHPDSPRRRRKKD